jgi:hypothetical protein
MLALLPMYEIVHNVLRYVIIEHGTGVDG